MPPEGRERPAQGDETTAATEPEEQVEVHRELQVLVDPAHLPNVGQPHQ